MRHSVGAATVRGVRTFALAGCVEEVPEPVPADVPDGNADSVDLDFELDRSGGGS